MADLDRGENHQKPLKLLRTFRQTEPDDAAVVCYATEVFYYETITVLVMQLIFSHAKTVFLHYTLK